MRAAILSACVFLSACASRETSRSSYESVVLPRDPTTPGCWNPGPEQTRELADALPAYLARSTGGETSGIASLQAYVCQYFGITIDGQRAIRASFLSRRAMQEMVGERWPADIWKREAIGVDGGGSSYFQAIYLVEEREFASLHINASR